MSDKLYEQETIIQFCDEPGVLANVWSASPAFQRRMEKLGIVRGIVRKRQGETYSAEYLIPKQWIKIHTPRLLTEEQRERMKERGRSMQASKRGELRKDY